MFRGERQRPQVDKQPEAYLSDQTKGQLGVFCFVVSVVFLDAVGNAVRDGLGL